MSIATDSTKISPENSQNNISTKEIDSDKDTSKSTQETTPTVEDKEFQAEKDAIIAETFEEIGIQKSHVSRDGHVKNIWKLNLKERMILEAIMFAPAIMVLAILFTTQNFLWTLWGFHIVLIITPLLFIKKRNIISEWKWLLFEEIMRKGGRIKHCMKIIALPVILCMTGYVAFRNFDKDFDVVSLRIPTIDINFTSIMLGFEFVILNPIIEEIFWRVFCDSFTGKGKTFLQKLDLSFHYAVFHWFVIYFICQDILLSFAGFMGIWVLGYILAMTKERLGLITAMLIHLGVDLSAGLAIWDMRSKFIKAY